MKQRTYIAIDLKSFYASAECVRLGLDPMDANLVVADESRSDKTICLAVSPSLKALGIAGRPRLFEVKQKVKEINRRRLVQARGRFAGKSTSGKELRENPNLEIDFVIAVPRMAAYMKKSREIYSVYLNFVAKEDIHVYSIDEVFIDITDYLTLYQTSAYTMAERMIHAVLEKTGITATAGIGTNLYLAKVAMDIVAKHIEPDAHGVRIAALDEDLYRRLLWAHEPLTDFWRVGKGIAAKLHQAGIRTMGDIARMALKDDSLFYDLFGVNAEFLIDHAFGIEPAEIKDIKSYTPEESSITAGQVLMEPYSHYDARLIVREMAESLAEELLERKQIASALSLYVGYDIDNLRDRSRMENYEGEMKKDWYGRTSLKAGGGNVKLKEPTGSAKIIVEELLKLYERTSNPSLLVRRIHLSASGLINESDYRPKSYEMIDLFTDYEAKQEEQRKKEKALEKERRVREAMLEIHNRFGKNAVLKANSLEEGSTAKERNTQIGGHKA